jgi:F-type H+-transporting ATPase subunit a
MIIAKALDFPPLSHILRWKDIFPSFNKIALICVLASLITAVLFLLAGKGSHTDAPKGIKNFAETIVEFVQKQIILPTIGEHGLAWTPFLLTIFCFVFLTNLPGIIPTFQMPANARLFAGPIVLSLTVWATFIGVGLKHQGPGYFGHLLWPPGVPTALKPLVGVIEFVSTIIVTPFSLAVRLFANLMAGHILLFTFSWMTRNMIASVPWLKALSFLPFLMLVFMTLFEVLVAFLQAYIFAMLSSVYISNSMAGHGDDH